MIECVAEMTINHLGNLNLLLRMVESAVKAGATSIKMQKKDVETFYSQEKLDRSYDSPYGKTYRDYRSTFEFDNGSDWCCFSVRCATRGIPWFVTLQDIPSLDFMLDHYRIYSHCLRFKIASSNARNWLFLEELSRRVSKEYEIVLSVAGSTLPEIEKALNFFSDHKRIYLLHCVAEYPCPVERLRLGNIAVLKREFGSDQVRIGYSGHEKGITGSIAAAALGAEMIERHFCLSRQSFVHHIECSLEPDEFKQMVGEVGNAVSGRLEVPGEWQGSYFGMSHEESLFLEHQTYGTEKLGRESRFQNG